MAGLSNYAENQLLRLLFTALSVTRPTARYCALHTQGPGEAGAVGELTGMGRKSVTFGGPANNQVLNLAVLTFTNDNPALARYATHWSLWTASSGGSCLGQGTLKEKVKLTNRGSYSVPIGGIVVEARGLSPEFAAVALNWLLRDVAIDRPTEWWLAVHQGLPDVSGIGGEYTANGCERQEVQFDAPAQGVAETTGTTETKFGPATADWPRITHYSIWDAQSAGNCLHTAAFKTKYLVQEGGSLQFDAGDIKIIAA
jgi:hypothetical protein